MDIIRQSSRYADRLDSNGVWKPPRPLGSNKIQDGDTTGLIFYFNGNRVEQVASLPPNVVVYRTTSLYFNNETFWGVPYDATRAQVGNGRQDSGDTSSDDDADGEEEVAVHSRYEWLDWHRLGFRHQIQTYTSIAMIAGPEDRLVAQRPDQRWVQELLPDVYHAPDTHSRSTDPRVGTMNGDLTVLIALLALSVRPDLVKRTLEHCIRGDGWRHHSRPRREGCQYFFKEYLSCDLTSIGTERRGVMVTVWRWNDPQVDYSAELQAYEGGSLGSILP